MASFQTLGESQEERIAFSRKKMEHLTVGLAFHYISLHFTTFHCIAPLFMHMQCSLQWFSLYQQERFDCWQCRVFTGFKQRRLSSRLRFPFRHQSLQSLGRGLCSWKHAQHFPALESMEFRHAACFLGRHNDARTASCVVRSLRTTVLSVRLSCARTTKYVVTSVLPRLPHFRPTRSKSAQHCFVSPQLDCRLSLTNTH